MNDTKLPTTNSDEDKQREGWPKIEWLIFQATGVLFFKHEDGRLMFRTGGAKK